MTIPNLNEYDIANATPYGENAESRTESYASYDKTRGRERLGNATAATNFEQQIEREFCQGSAIAPSLYNVNIDIIEDTGRWEPNEALNQKVPRFWETRQPHNFGAIAMFRQEDGEHWQGKPQKPRPNLKKSKTALKTKLRREISDQEVKSLLKSNPDCYIPNKYEALEASGSRAYLPPVDVRTRAAIALRYGCGMLSEGRLWGDVTAHPELPIIITEGGKKGLALLSQGYIAIALTGVNGGYRTNDRIGADVVPLEKPRLIEDLKRFVVKGRRIILAFDQDEKEKTRSAVTAALFKLGGLLKAAGADVAIASWEANQGKGIDDLIVNCGAAAANQAIDEAVSFDQWAIERKLSQRVRRKPDLNIGEREFVEVADSLPQDRDIALYGGKGTGKSKAIAKLLDGETWLSVTSLRSLARGQAEAWNGAFINDGGKHGNSFLKNGKLIGGGSVCIPSLLKVRSIDADVVVGDEITAGLQFLLTSKLANKDGIRPMLLAEFERRAREAKRLIIADADMTEEVLSYLEKLRGQRFYLVRSQRKPLQWKANLIDTKKEAIAELFHRTDNLSDDKILCLNCDEKSTANAMAVVLEGKGIKSLLITQETSGGEVERSFLASKGRDLPELLSDGIRAIISSPSVTQGFSIEENTDLIDSVWGIYAGTSISADAIAQALDRVRAPIDHFICVPKRGRAYSKLSKALNRRQFISEFKSASTSTARLARLSLKPETITAVDGIDWESENIKLLASFEVSRNQGMIALQDTVCALLRHEGKTIERFTSQLGEEATKEAAALISGAILQANEARLIAVAGAATIGATDAAELEKKARSEVLTQEEIYSLEKFYISDFYRLNEIDSEDVRFDKKGATRQQIRNLEALLDEAIALGRSAKSIDATPTTPQDWDKAVLRRWLLVQTGAADFLLGVWDGSIVDLTADIVEPLATKLKAHATQFRVAFGFSNLDKVSDIQAIATLMDCYGLKRICHQYRVGKERIRSYTVDADHLEKLKSIVQRRDKCVTPPQTDLLNRGGVTAPEESEWLSQESLQDVREWIEVADTCPDIAALLATVPEQVKQRALAA